MSVQLAKVKESQLCESYRKSQYSSCLSSRITFLIKMLLQTCKIHKPTYIYICINLYTHTKIYIHILKFHVSSLTVCQGTKKISSFIFFYILVLDQKKSPISFLHHVSISMYKKLQKIQFLCILYQFLPITRKHRRKEKDVHLNKLMLCSLSKKSSPVLTQTNTAFPAFAAQHWVCIWECTQ